MSLALCYAYMLKTALSASSSRSPRLIAAGALLRCRDAKLALVKVYHRPPLLDDEIAERSREILGAAAGTCALWRSTPSRRSRPSPTFPWQSRGHWPSGCFRGSSTPSCPSKRCWPRRRQRSSGAGRHLHRGDEVSGCLEEYKCPASENGVRSRDQRIDRMAMRTYQLQQQVFGAVDPFLFFDRVKARHASQS